MPDGRRKLTDEELRVHAWRTAVDTWRSKRAPVTSRLIYAQMQIDGMTAGQTRIQKALDVLVADGKLVDVGKQKFRPRLRSDV
jgi:hypothetical protein